MIKVSRPDGRPEQLGFRVLDEPGSQSFDLENMKIDDENGKKKGKLCNEYKFSVSVNQVSISNIFNHKIFLLY